MDDGDRLRSYFISGNPFLDIARGTATVCCPLWSCACCLSASRGPCRLLSISQCGYFPFCCSVLRSQGKSSPCIAVSSHNPPLMQLQVAAGIMLGREAFAGARSLFIAKCDCCRGTGRLVCPVCRGFNRLRRWPGEFHAHRGGIVNQKKADE